MTPRYPGVELVTEYKEPVKQSPGESAPFIGFFGFLALFVMIVLVARFERRGTRRSARPKRAVPGARVVRRRG